ncbi:hypothetical protein IAQ61_006312 [Plenodomus lingam]|uniref:uncharacterized protein n=1 Tax=Leptosphaeria maculans TaxID=5022 RepID=UPI00331FE747|nr:hypothetical protein IAQ61_006312 [Plenodomus lingam]
MIYQAFSDAQRLANFAAHVLERPDVENSLAFDIWFGMRRPTTSEDIFAEIDPTGVVIGCTAPDVPDCTPHKVALASEYRSTEDGDANVLLLCPYFFTFQDPLQDLIESIRTQTVKFNAGFALLHEFQHFGAVVGAENVCEDYEYLFYE